MPAMPICHSPEDRYRPRQPPRRAAAARTDARAADDRHPRSLREETGCWAYDPSLGETGVCRSTITYVDGDNGVLLYRGYPIDQLVERWITSKCAGCCSMANCRAPRSEQIHRTTSPITRC